MRDGRIDILYVSTADRLGGAERVAWDLFAAQRDAGHGAWLAVGRKRTADAGVLTIDHAGASGPWGRFWWGWHERLQSYYSTAWGRRLCRWTHRLAAPRGGRDARAGREDFNYPGARRLLDLPPRRPDVVHLHNLHGGYFDLRALPALSRAVPTVVTLHDAWLLAGHCAHSFDCDRWMTGCGECPDLSIYPAVRRDATAENWRAKAAIYRDSRLYVATPCRWLMERVRRSMLWPAVVEARVIPYGVDLRVFRPGDRAAARAKLGLPADAAVLLFAANGVRRNAFKDYATLRAAIGRIGAALRGRAVQFVAVGESAPDEAAGAARIRFVPFQAEPAAMAAYYQAADVYLHAARADTFPCTVLEALACGLPVAATGVGGIPEQVTEETGVVTPAGDAGALAAGAARLLADAGLRARMGAAAARDAAARFDLRRQARDYADWYAAILAGAAAGARGGVGETTTGCNASAGARDAMTASI